MVEEFADREAASVAAADIMESSLQRRLAAAAQATLVVSGGTTPARTFEHLALRDLPWSNIHVVPSDERCVPADHEDSNERLVRRTLMTGAAAEAQFQPLFADNPDHRAGAEQLDKAVRDLPFPFACALLGMGEDGHFASLFPDSVVLEEGLDVDSAMLVLPATTAASPFPRMTLTLAALSRSDQIVLLVFGEKKRDVIERAAASNDGLPVAYLLRQKRAPLRVLWAP
jgi:6-phosphogluconolactonase